MSTTSSSIVDNMISFISVVPNKEQRVKLYDQSIKAREQSLSYQGVDSPKYLLSKNPLCKDTGFSTTIFASRQDLAFYKDEHFAIFLTQNVTMIGGSMGVNCVPTTPVSINLFDTDEKTTRSSLDKFMKWRYANKMNIFKAYVHSLEQFLKIPEKRIILEKALLTRGQEHLEIEIAEYIEIVSFLKSILDAATKKNDILDSDLVFISFCQSWIKKGIVGNPSFSVPSPHFQTLIFVNKKDQDWPEGMKEMYNRFLMVLSYDMTTKIVNESLEYEESFVNLDALFKNMNQKNIFFLNSAPSFDTLPLIAETRESSEDGDFSLVVSTSLCDYIAAIGTIESSEDFNVSTLPSNFRATIKPGVKMNGIECTEENYLQIQKNISSALAAIFSWCDKEGVDVFFASLPRSVRPLYIKSPSSKASRYNLNYDKDLTLKVVDELLIPALADKMNIDPSPELVIKALDQFTEHKASFLADVGTVAVAYYLLDNDLAWYSYQLLEKPNVVESDNKASYVSANFIRGPGKFKSLSLEGFVMAAEKAILKALECTYPVWKTCYVMHDEFLNDIDDIAANALARGLTKRGGFYLFKNYD